MLDTLIDTCLSEIRFADKQLNNPKSSKHRNELLREKAYWQGKLDVAKYAKLFTE